MILNKVTATLSSDWSLVSRPKNIVSGKPVTYQYSAGSINLLIHIILSVMLLTDWYGSKKFGFTFAGALDCTLQKQHICFI